MLNALKNLGEILLQQANHSLIDTLVQNPKEGVYERAIVLLFDKEGNFQGSELEDIKEDRLYLYRRGSSNGTDFSPTSKITEPKKTFARFRRWLKEHSKEPLIAALEESVVLHEDEILKQIEEKNSKHEILTVKIDGKYLYEIELFRAIFLQDILAKLKKNTKKGVCSLCLEHKEVFNASIYKFFTLDKECYIANGFDQKRGVELFPICQECYLKADYAKRYVEKNLTFNFYNRYYHLIPKLIVADADVLEELRLILEYAYSSISFDRPTFVADEEDILALLQEFNNAITFYMLFLKGGGNQDKERIELLVEEVVPSRIRALFDAKKEVEEWLSEPFVFKLIYPYLKEHKRFYYEFIDKLLTGGSFEKEIFLARFMERIGAALEEGWFKKEVRNALAVYLFLEKLQIIKGNDMERLLQQFPQLDSPQKLGVFYLGALTQSLLDIQYAKKGSAPFTKQLKSLKMRYEDVKALLPKVINKLIEYDHYDHKRVKLAEMASQELLKTVKPLRSDELNFYFAAGMALHDEVFNTLNETLKKDEQ